MSYAAEYADFPMPIMMIAYADNDDYIMVMTSCDYDVLRWWFLTMICYDNEFKLWWWLWFLLWWFPMTMSYKFGIWFLMTSYDDDDDDVSYDDDFSMMPMMIMPYDDDWLWW